MYLIQSPTFYLNPTVVGYEADDHLKLYNNKKARQNK